MASTIAKCNPSYRDGITSTWVGGPYLLDRSESRENYAIVQA